MCLAKRKPATNGQTNEAHVYLRLLSSFDLLYANDLCLLEGSYIPPNPHICHPPIIICNSWKYIPCATLGVPPPELLHKYYMQIEKFLTCLSSHREDAFICKHLSKYFMLISFPARKNNVTLCFYQYSIQIKRAGSFKPALL